MIPIFNLTDWVVMHVSKSTLELIFLLLLFSVPAVSILAFLFAAIWNKINREENLPTTEKAVK